MVRVLPTVDYPQALLAHLKTFGGYFPDKVKWDPETYTVEVTEQMPLELRVSMSYLHLVGDIQDVMDNIELVLVDLVSLSEHPPQDPKEGERRYFLLTKLFFYELLRIRDAIPRFLKRFEEHGLMSKDDRHATKSPHEQRLLLAGSVSSQRTPSEVFGSRPHHRPAAASCAVRELEDPDSTAEFAESSWSRSSSSTGSSSIYAAATSIKG